MFSSIEAAIDYIRSKLQDFYNRRYEMTDLYQQARANLQEAYVQGRFIEDARQSYDEVLQVLYEHNQLSDKLHPLASAFDVNTGLGLAVPAAVWTAIYLVGGATAVILAAEMMYDYFQRLQVQAVKVRQIKEGLLPATALDRPGAIAELGGLTGNLVLLALVGIGGYMLWRTR